MGFLKYILAMAFISKGRYEEDKDKAEEYTEDFIYHHLDSETEADDYELHNTEDGGEEF